MFESFLAGAAGGAAALSIYELLRARKERRMKREFFKALDEHDGVHPIIPYAPLEDDNEGGNR